MPSRQPARKTTASASRKRAPAGVSTHQAQAAAERVDLVEKVELNGRAFGLAERVGLMPMILLAVVGKRGVDANAEEGLVAIYEVLRDAIDPEDFDGFLEHAITTKADGDDLMAVIRSAVETMSARPTGSPNGSSAGRRTTSQSSKESSSRTATPPDGMVPVSALLGR